MIILGTIDFYDILISSLYLTSANSQSAIMHCDDRKPDIKSDGNSTWNKRGLLSCETARYHMATDMPLRLKR